MSDRRRSGGREIERNARGSVKIRFAALRHRDNLANDADKNSVSSCGEVREKPDPEGERGRGVKTNRGIFTVLGEQTDSLSRKL